MNSHPSNRRYQILFLVAIASSVLLVLAVLALLVWQLGWGILIVLGSAFVVFVLWNVGLNAVRDAQRAKRSATRQF